MIKKIEYIATLFGLSGMFLISHNNVLFGLISSSVASILYIWIFIHNKQFGLLIGASVYFIVEIYGILMRTVL